MTTTVAPIPRVGLTPAEAAQALGLHRATIYRLMATGELPYRQIGARRRIARSTLEAFVAQPANASLDLGDAPTVADTGRIGIVDVIVGGLTSFVIAQLLLTAIGAR